jgi:hypothetical protein
MILPGETSRALLRNKRYWDELEAQFLGLSEDGIISAVTFAIRFDTACEFVATAVLSGDKSMLRICNDVRDDSSKNVSFEIMKAARDSGRAKRASPGPVPRISNPSHKQN